MKKKSNKKPNYFQQQEANKKNPEPKRDKAHYKEVKKAPILKVLEKSQNEEAHFDACYRFAKKMSDPNSTEIQTVHLNMKDQLLFNMEQDEEFTRLWQAHELLLLVEFPKNWKTMEIDTGEEYDDDDFDFEDVEERFDYLYETSMRIYEK
ncbi:MULTISPECIES: hypothetical protein [unclassified Fusibacter]|uniref:hypothetical protein n=1 Tax=unclassified Fusibacter TaxID=2624464 RepID=UPI001013104F|nr:MULTISPECIES: hypothetical protein [unclassified Fusibacter]MCK8060447.1 hypothetical protein [Fusibacter sp. A2]NPE20264.1 hypothetical protein [Fusibacter sp. A1]RXV63471.1 hypothetical protein DWB64_00430 [Fusibacter sp. A1]